MWRIILGMLIGSGILAWWGAQDLYTAVKNWSPESMTCDEYAQRRPDDEWLELTECTMWPEDMAIESEHDRVTRIYVPLLGTSMLPASEDATPPRTPIALVSEDPELISLVTRMEAGDEAATMEMTRTYVVPRDYHGLVQFGARLDDRARREVSGIASQSLDSSFVLLEDGAEPSFLWGIAKLIGAGLLLVGAGAIVFRRRRSA